MTSSKSSELPEQQPKYYSYLLRLWQAGSETEWHIYLQDVNSGVQRRFPSLESLNAYLQSQVNAEQTD